MRRHRNQGPPYQPDRPYSPPSNNKSPRRETSRPTFTPYAANGNAESTHTHSYTALANPAESRTGKRPNHYGPLGSHDSASPNPARQRTPDGHASPPESAIPLQTTFRNSSSSRLSASSPTVSTSQNPPPLTSPVNSASNSGAVPVHEVFVVHHDAGAPPPVTVYALPGSRVTELPPGYNFGSRSPDSAARHSPARPQLTLVGEPVSPEISTSRRDQKASFTPRSPPAPSTTSPLLDSTSPKSSTFDEQAHATNPTRLLPSTPQMQSSTQLPQTPSIPDLSTSITSRTRGPRPRSPHNDKEKEHWK